MDKKTKFVKFCLWVGIILDGSTVFLYLFPNLMLNSMGLPKDALSPVAIYLLFHAGIFMLAWTLLLIWTLQKPIQRRFVFLLTVLVVVGLEASAIYLMTVESIDKAGVIPLLVLPAIAGSLFTAGYFVTGSIKKKQG